MMPASVKQLQSGSLSGQAHAVPGGVMLASASQTQLVSPDGQLQPVGGEVVEPPLEPPPQLLVSSSEQHRDGSG
jgi:hypothetical protein